VILNRRDSARSALTVSSFWLATSSFVREARTFIRATTSVSARNDALFALIDGKVKFERMGKDRKMCSVYAEQ